MPPGRTLGIGCRGLRFVFHVEWGYVFSIINFVWFGFFINSLNKKIVFVYVALEIGTSARVAVGV